KEIKPVEYGRRTAGMPELYRSTFRSVREKFLNGIAGPFKRPFVALAPRIPSRAQPVMTVMLDLSGLGWRWLESPKFLFGPTPKIGVHRSSLGDWLQGIGV